MGERVRAPVQGPVQGTTARSEERRCQAEARVSALGEGAPTLPYRDGGRHHRLLGHRGGGAEGIGAAAFQRRHPTTRVKRSYANDVGRRERGTVASDVHGREGPSLHRDEEIPARECARRERRSRRVQGSDGRRRARKMVRCANRSGWCAERVPGIARVAARWLRDYRAGATRSSLGAMAARTPRMRPARSQRPLV